MQSPRHLRILLALAAVAAVGTTWWLLTRNEQASAPMAASPQAVGGHRAETPVAPVGPAPLAVVAPIPTGAPAAVGPRVEVAPAPVAPATGAAATAQPPELAPAVPTAAPVTDEVAATERMYLAHAPLRTREVADPDSESNRRILQTMVGKALRQDSSPPTTVAP